MAESAPDPVAADTVETVELSDVVAPVVKTTGSAVPSGPAPSVAEPVPPAADPDETLGRPLTSADVWRAARARRKALRAEIRRFTQRSRRRRMVWWGSIGAVAALVLGTLIAAYSPLFAVEKVTVAGAGTLDADAVEAALAGQIGTPLALVDRSEVRSALLEFPMIETYSLELRPPHELLVRVVERTPIGVVKTDAGYSLLDAAGVVLSTTPERPEGAALLEITGGPESDAFASAGLVMRSLPAELRKTVTDVAASSVDDVTLTLEGDRTVVWGNAEQSSRKAYTLDKLIAARPDATSYDVSSPDVAVVG
ncbi:FtsQ-type POTRA domain-containing protein [Microbacterium istanbulense]|uniref:FtsQ-type POTRA domain-containing protein n=1 Tax=Microbacterium istanbulense TaxID=3122049 RepID=A0ABU8LJS8_9MICO